MSSILSVNSPSSLNLAPILEAPFRGGVSVAYQVQNEVNPTGVIEHALAAEISWRLQEMQEFRAAIGLLHRSGGDLADVLNVIGDSRAAVDAAQISVLASSKHESLVRQSLASSRGFTRALHELNQLRGRANGGPTLSIDPRFQSERSCCTYLVRRFASGLTTCQHCGETREGSFVPSRLSWQCARCRAQTGIRTGTCMERSPLPLVKWFGAIRSLLLAPATTNNELAVFLQIRREQTIRKLAAKIRTAMSAPDASLRLAGLDEVYLGY